MKALDIVKQLQATLPIYTELFSDVVTVNSLTKSGTTITATAASAHDLNTGDYVNIQGARVPNMISSLTQTNNIATATTSNGHDLTKSLLDKNDKFIEISGATQSEYNGTKKLLSVIDSKTFTYEISGNPASPATGSPVLNEDIENLYNGWFEVTKISDTQFSYTVRKEPLANASGTIKTHSDMRITRASTPADSISAYTKKQTDKLWAFIVLGQTNASKNQNSVRNDGVGTYDSQTDYRPNLYQDFNIYTFDPAKTTYASAERRDRAEDIRAIFFKCLLGVKFERSIIDNFDILTSGNEKHKTMFVSDQIEQDVNAYYVHNYQFQITYDLNDDDIVKPQWSTAFKEFEIKQLNIDTDLEIRNIKGKLQGD
jgi:hypothetical protein